jgi:hypothetical protein
MGTCAAACVCVCADALGMRSLHSSPPRAVEATSTRSDGTPALDDCQVRVQRGGGGACLRVAVGSRV